MGKPSRPASTLRSTITNGFLLSHTVPTATATPSNPTSSASSVIGELSPSAGATGFSTGMGGSSPTRTPPPVPPPSSVPDPNPASPSAPGSTAGSRQVNPAVIIVPVLLGCALVAALLFWVIRRYRDNALGRVHPFVDLESQNECRIGNFLHCREKGSANVDISRENTPESQNPNTTPSFFKILQVCRSNVVNAFTNTWRNIWSSFNHPPAMDPYPTGTGVNIPGIGRFQLSRAPPFPSHSATPAGFSGDRENYISRSASLDDFQCRGDRLSRSNHHLSISLPSSPQVMTSAYLRCFQEVRDSIRQLEHSPTITPTMEDDLTRVAGLHRKMGELLEGVGAEQVAHRPPPPYETSHSPRRIH
ncbi:hypothetical protein BD779DRAFT_937713 [Infundibulicybe gibba]|nr:hypothetical protein BD779DRAFT_937713 [Infundibulicybe gibba]